MKYLKLHTSGSAEPIKQRLLVLKHACKESETVGKYLARLKAQADFNLPGIALCSEVDQKLQNTIVAMVFSVH